jgi:hypothetical protein
VTLLAGAYLYGKERIDRAPFANAPNAVLSIAGLLGLAAFLYTLFVMHPRERSLRRWLREHPAPLAGEDKRRFHEESQRIGKLVAMGAPLLFLALLLMLARPVIA